MFYCFTQNNSGGSFDRDHHLGISRHVVVEGASLREIVERAKDMGIYFNGCDTRQDCPCCGDRWYEPWGTDSTDTVPTINGQDVSNGCYSSEYHRWIDDGPEGYIHYLDGRIVPVEHISK